MKVLLVFPKPKWRTQNKRVKDLATYLTSRYINIYGEVKIDVVNIDLPTLKLTSQGVFKESDIKAITEAYRANYDTIGVIFPITETTKYVGNYYTNTDKTDHKLDFYITANEKSSHQRRGKKVMGFEEIVEHEISHAVALDIGLTGQSTDVGYKQGADNTHHYFYDKEDNLNVWYKELLDAWKKKAGVIQKIVDAIDNLLSKLPKKNSKVKPLTPKHWKNITQGYGVKNPIYRTTGYHIGVDFACPIGTKIRARENGEITFAGFHEDLGNFCYFKFKGYEERYLHLDKVPVRGKYQQGETIAVTGNTGFSTGPHLHLDTFINKVQKVTKTNWRKITVDPLSI